jgi:hypothetical protein
MRALVGAFDQLAIKHRDDDETQISSASIC